MSAPVSNDPILLLTGIGNRAAPSRFDLLKRCKRRPSQMNERASCRNRGSADRASAVHADPFAGSHASSQAGNELVKTDHVGWCAAILNWICEKCHSALHSEM